MEVAVEDIKESELTDFRLAELRYTSVKEAFICGSSWALIPSMGREGMESRKDPNRIHKFEA